MGVLVGVSVGGTGVLVGVLVGVSVGATGVLVGVLVGVSVGATGVLVGVLVGVSVGGTGVLVGVGVGVKLEPMSFKQTASNLKVLCPSLRAITRTLTALVGRSPLQGVLRHTRRGVVIVHIVIDGDRL